MEWKSFVDEKPENNQYFVMASFHQGCVPHLILGDHLLDRRIEEDPNFWTHWIPIPNPPKNKKTYPAPKVGTIVTEENLNEFIEKYSLWLVLQGIGDGYYLSNYNGEYVSAFQLRFGDYLPYQVKRVEDTDEIIWKQEEV